MSTLPLPLAKRRVNRPFFTISSRVRFTRSESLGTSFTSALYNATAGAWSSSVPLLVLVRVAMSAASRAGTTTDRNGGHRAWGGPRRGSNVAMEYRQLGSSDLRVSEISLGSWL